MFIIILSTLLILSIAANIALGYGALNTLQNLESYAAFFEEVKIRIEKVIEHMHAVDTRGAFESDDEVGSIFTELKATVQSLDIFLIGEDEETPKEETKT